MKKEAVPKDDDDTRTPWERFVETARHVVGVPKEEIKRRERAWRRKRSKISR